MHSYYTKHFHDEMLVSFSEYCLIDVGADVTPVLDTVAMSKLSSLNSQLIHDINVLHYTNTAGSVGIT